MVAEVSRVSLHSPPLGDVRKTNKWAAITLVKIKAVLQLIAISAPKATYITRYYQHA